jgi:uracil-DNA glycosylase
LSGRKQPQLERLAEEISARIPNAWLYPQRGTVQGFLGAGRVMFIGDQPSTGVFGSAQDLLLYRLLKKYDLADCHLTDLVKTRGKTGEPYPAMAIHRRFLDMELDIVRPTRIVAFGQKIHDMLQFSLAGSGIKITPIWHYTYLRRRPDAVAVFETQLREAIGGK